MSSIHPEIAAACARADLGLWAAFARSQHPIEPKENTGKLVFPTYRGGALRVSEQEARFAFVEALGAGPLLYAVEAPTSKRYQFSGQTPLSAQTDLAIYDPSSSRICNVEFKAKGFSPSAKKHFTIYKDLQKLLREPLWGLWFHLLQAVDNSTIRALLRVMAAEIERVREEYGRDIEAPGLTVHICVLQHRFSIRRNVILSRLTSATEDLQRQLRLDLRVSRSELKSVSDPNGWSIHTLHDRSETRPESDPTSEIAREEQRPLS